MNHVYSRLMSRITDNPHAHTLENNPSKSICNNIKPSNECIVFQIGYRHMVIQSGYTSITNITKERHGKNHRQTALMHKTPLGNTCVLSNCVACTVEACSHSHGVHTVVSATYWRSSDYIWVTLDFIAFNTKKVQ